MVRLKFIIKDGSLVLRISEFKERYYKSVKQFLIGSPNLRYWDSKKERFNSYYTSYVENNNVLERFKSVYSRLTTEYPELTARQIAVFYKHRKKGTIPGETIEISNIQKHYQNSVEEFLKVIIEREKHKQGSNFESYDRLLKKCRKIMPDFSSLTFQSIDFEKCLSIAKILARHKGYRGLSKAFRALLGKADKDKDVKFSISQIGDFVFQDYNPDKYNTLVRIPDVLSPDQLRRFLSLDIDKITPTYRDRKSVRLKYDFCVFMFYSFFAPCDVIKLKHKDITNRNTLIMRRKKTVKLVEVPITPVMSDIIKRYSGTGKGDYIFPIMDDKKVDQYVTRDYLFKRFVEKLNLWLKQVGRELNLNFKPYAYIFRHTGITTALNGGLPISYVAKLAGSRVDIIQDYYYNGNGPEYKERLYRIFENAAL